MWYIIVPNCLVSVFNILLEVLNLTKFNIVFFLECICKEVLLCVSGNVRCPVSTIHNHCNPTCHFTVRGEYETSGSFLLLLIRLVN